MNNKFVFVNLVLASVSIMMGIALKTVFPSSPTFGWLLGLLFLVIASFFAQKKS